MLDFIRDERRKRDQRIADKHHAEGRAQGRAEGLAEGIAQGTATTNDTLRAWIEDLRQQGLIDWPEDNPPPYVRPPAD